MDWVAPMLGFKFKIQDFKFGLDLADCSLISALNVKVFIQHELEFL